MSEQPKITLVQKKIIYSILYGKYNILSITFARIHTCGIKSEYWLYSGLEGALIYCINAELSLSITDSYNYKKVADDFSVFSDTEVSKWGNSVGISESNFNSLVVPIKFLSEY